MIYLLFGEEKYDLGKFVDKVKKSFPKLENGINLFNISIDNIDELDNIYSAITFFGDSKLVIIKDTNLKFDAKKLIANANENDIYLIIEDILDKRTSSYKELSNKVSVKEFKKLSLNEMIRYIMDILKLYKLKISYKDAEYFVNVCGQDKTNNINELKKIVGYLKENEVVTKDVIDKICSKTLNAKVFDMIEVATNKQKEKAIKMLDELIVQKEPPIKIALLLYKQIKQMYLIKYLQNKNEKNIKDKLNMNLYVYNKISKSTQNYTLEMLRKLINEFDIYDSKTKVGDMDFEIGLKKIICLM